MRKIIFENQKELLSKEHHFELLEANILPKSTLQDEKIKLEINHEIQVRGLEEEKSNFNIIIEKEADALR